jgi:hypothetical protein
MYLCSSYKRDDEAEYKHTLASLFCYFHHQGIRYDTRESVLVGLDYSAVRIPCCWMGII